MTPFLQKTPYPQTLALSKILYTQDTILTLQKALGSDSAIHEYAEKVYIDISQVSQQECFEMLNFCLYQTQKQK